MANRASLDRSSSEIAVSAAAPTSINGNEQSGLDPRVSSEDVDAQRSTSVAQDESSIAYDNVLQSDIGVNTLLTRLKQSVASARDFAVFLKKRSSLEEEHAQGLKKLCRTIYESTRRPDSRQGSYSKNYEDITRIHDRMADNGIQFALSLHQMHEDLQELAADKERGRKQWKATGLSAEKRVQDSETGMDKAKMKYSTLAEDYDRARTGDKQSGRFGLKGPKSAAQVEEELHRKMQAADTDYASKVQTAQSMRRELMTTSRPQAVQALQQLINECDSGLTLQMQKYASFNEKLLLGNGLCVSPLKGQASQTRSLRDVVYQIDNDQDLKNYVISFASRIAPKQSEPQYERHRSLQPAQQMPPIHTGIQQTQPFPPTQQMPQTQVGQPPPQSSFQAAQMNHPMPSAQSISPVQQLQSPNANPAAPRQQPLQMPGYQASQFPGMQPNPNQSMGTMHSPGYNNQAPISSSYPTGPPVPTNSYSESPKPAIYPPGGGSSAPPHLLHTQYLQSPQGQMAGQMPLQSPAHQNGQHVADAPPPVRPVFGMSLEDLFARDGSAVPMVVYQCLQAVDLYGLEVEGIYRLSGTSSHVTKLRSMFDNDASRVDFRNPENFFHDVNSVAGLLKQFFRDLPDPLLTLEHYQGFIQAAREDDDIARRDQLHATINSLPDPNYATLRALALHLHRVQEHSNINRMNAGNLAICFGPTLMGSNTGPNIADAGWQVRVIDTILQNTYEIFDED